jgi:O-antigen ligase
VSLKTNFFNDHFSNDFFHFSAVILLSILPLLFFLGTGVINLSIIILDIIFISEILMKKRLNFLKNYIFYSLIFLWFTFLINIFFSIDPSNSFSRGFGFIRFIFFVMLILYYFNINNEKYRKLILYSWLVIFSITSLDLIFEYINGKNILGFTSYIHGRLAGFYNDELIIGNFYYAFILIIISFLIVIFSNKRLNIVNKVYDLKNFVYLLIFLFLLISFLIGERSNFSKVFIMVLLFTFLFEKKLFKLKIILFSLFFISIFLIINSNYKWKTRFLDQYVYHYLQNPIKNIFNSVHGGHYLTALEIYDNNKIFGVGFKNYPIELQKRKYMKKRELKAMERYLVNPDKPKLFKIDKGSKALYVKGHVFYYWERGGPSTHAHQVHFEFLAELGLFGYFSLMIFFIYHFYKFIKKKNFNNNLNLSGLLFVFTSLLPLLPSGSFFTSHTAALFWMNFAFMCLNQKELKL